jgi:hypothetical protein
VSLLKVAFVQINYKPAFLFNQNNLIVEPFGDETTSITQLKYSGSDKMKLELEQKYLAWLKSKIFAILDKAKSLQIKLLLFPEYSIPANILAEIILYMKDKNCDCVVIAGTHVVTNNLKNTPQGYPSIAPCVSFALCPIITKDGILHYTFKTHKAFEETNNIRVPSSDVGDTFAFANYNLQVKICIDAISGGSSLEKQQGKIVAIPSMSRKVDPFNALSILSKFNDIPIIYANNASTGGSIIAGAFLQDGSHWFVDKTSTKPVPKGVECLVSAVIDLDNTKYGVGSVNITEPIKVESIVNILYSKDEDNNRTLSLIKKILEDGLTVFSEFSNNRIDSLLSDKIKLLENDVDNGVYVPEKAREILDYIEINAPTYNQMVFEQAEEALKRMAGNFSNGQTDPLYLINLTTISAFVNKRRENKIDFTTSVFNDEGLFRGREVEITSLGKFFDSEKSVLWIRGIRGIGKTKLINNISSSVLPNPCPWEIKIVNLEIGIGYSLLLDQIEFELGLTYIERQDKSPTEISSAIISQLEKKRPMIIAIDDMQNLTDVQGRFFDTQVKELFSNFISEIYKSTTIKLIISSSRKIRELESSSYIYLEMSRLSDDVVRFIVGYCFRKIANSTSTIKIEDSTVKFVYGNPLAAILIALLAGENKLHEFEAKGDVFNRFQEQQIKNMIGEISLSEKETKLMELLSISKGNVPYELINSKFPYLLPSIETLANRFLVEIIDTQVKIHPLLGEFYSNRIELIDRTKYHELYASYYESEYRECKKVIQKPNPEILANAIYHFGGSLQLKKLQEYKMIYVDQLKPIADQLYRIKNYDQAVTYYELIYEVNQNLRHDVFIRMAQCYVYIGKIELADRFFSLATGENQRGAYLWAQYSIALSSKPVYKDKAIELALFAEEIFYKYGNSFNWELAKIKFAQAKAYRYSDAEKALPLYDEACWLDKTNTYYLCMYAQALFLMGRNEDANEQLRQATIIDPHYHMIDKIRTKFNRQLTDEMSDTDLYIEDDSYLDGSEMELIEDNA